MKHTTKPVPGSNGSETAYSDTVSYAMGISEARNTELHKKLMDEVHAADAAGEPKHAGTLLNRVKNITTDAVEAAYMGFAICKTLDAMENPMAELLAKMKEEAGAE